jgi:hypothetical protein
MLVTDWKIELGLFIAGLSTGLHDPFDQQKDAAL